MPRKKESFVLVSLQEDQAKKLAQVVSNDTSRKILDYLTENDATESQLAKKLGVPISTIHYNLQALQKAKLVETEEFHYSEKGKEVLHYRLANKYIVIAPKSTFGLKEKLRNILPVMILMAGVGFVIQYIKKFFPKAAVPTLSRATEKTADFATAPLADADGAAEIVSEGIAEATYTESIAEVTVGDAAAQTAGEEIAEFTFTTAGSDGATEQVTNTIAEEAAVQSSGWAAPVGGNILNSPVFWFIIGAILALGLYLLISYIRRKK